ncbi:MAG: hypothetical protein ACREFQ_11610 [Stellaceae bacterium]
MPHSIEAHAAIRRRRDEIRACETAKAALPPEDPTIVRCHFDGGACELVKRLREASLSSPLFGRIAAAALREPNFLATALVEEGIDPRLALEIAAGLAQARRDPPLSCQSCEGASIAAGPTAASTMP